MSTSFLLVWLEHRKGILATSRINWWEIKRELMLFWWSSSSSHHFHTMHVKTCIFHSLNLCLNHQLILVHLYMAERHIRGLFSLSKFIFLIIPSYKAICNEAATNLPQPSRPWSVLLLIWAVIIISEDPREISNPLNTKALG